MKTFVDLSPDEAAVIELARPKATRIELAECGNPALIALAEAAEGDKVYLYVYDRPWLAERLFGLSENEKMAELYAQILALREVAKRC